MHSSRVDNNRYDECVCVFVHTLRWSLVQFLNPILLVLKTQVLIKFLSFLWVTNSFKVLRSNTSETNFRYETHSKYWDKKDTSKPTEKRFGFRMNRTV